MSLERAALLSLGLAAAALPAVAAGPIALEWRADGAFSREVAVPVGKFVEACGKLPAKAEVAWRFEAGGPLDFNIHFHEGAKVVFPAKKDQVAAASGTLDAKVPQDYCWMWTNKGSAEVALRLELTKR